MSFDFSHLKLEVMGRVDALRVAEWCAVAGIRKVGAGLFAAPCPFHAEKSPSFNIGGKKGFEHRFHCYGCGWDGDIFAFWQQLKGCDFKQALTDMARMAGVAMGSGVTWSRPVAPAAPVLENRLVAEDVPPDLPPLRHIRAPEWAMVAEKRGLDVDAVMLCARSYRRMAFSMWPLYPRRSGVWMPRCERHGKNGCELDNNSCVAAATFPSWCVIDDTRHVAEFRRLDNLPYETHRGAIKTWSTAGKNWPLGAHDLETRPAVMLVEGGPDMIAAYHFLNRHRMLSRVSVVCMLGAGNRMRESVLPNFAGKRVRIMVDADALKDDENASKRRVPGMEAAARWSAQLVAAGAAVETFCVGPVYDTANLQAWGRGDIKAAAVKVITPGLMLPDGSAVKDLNDLAKCSDEVLSSDDVRQAFRQWDF